MGTSGGGLRNFPTRKRFITSQTVRFVPVRMVQDSYKDWLSTAEIMKSEEKNDANRRNSGDIRMLGAN